MLCFETVIPNFYYRVDVSTAICRPTILDPRRPTPRTPGTVFTYAEHAVLLQRIG